VIDVQESALQFQLVTNEKHHLRSDPRLKHTLLSPSQLIFRM
jgi:hypothetical protein